MDKIILVVDNFLVYVASKVNGFWIKSRIKILKIALYFQNLNPIEKVTLSIKSKPAHIYQMESASIKNYCRTQSIILLFKIYQGLSVKW